MIHSEYHFPAIARSAARRVITMCCSSCSGARTGPLSPESARAGDIDKTHTAKMRALTALTSHLPITSGGPHTHVPSEPPETPERTAVGRVTRVAPIRRRDILFKRRSGLGRDLIVPPRHGEADRPEEDGTHQQDNRHEQQPALRPERLPPGCPCSGAHLSMPPRTSRRTRAELLLGDRAKSCVPSSQPSARMLPTSLFGHRSRFATSPLACTQNRLAKPGAQVRPADPHCEAPWRGGLARRPPDLPVNSPPAARCGRGAGSCPRCVRPPGALVLA